MPRRCQVRPLADVQSTGVRTSSPPTGRTFSPTAVNPPPVCASACTRSPPASGAMPGPRRQERPSGDVHAASGPSASHRPWPPATISGVPPPAGPRKTVNRQVRPPSSDVRARGRAKGSAACEPTATTVRPDAAIPVSEGGTSCAGAPPGPANCASASRADGEASTGPVGPSGARPTGDDDASDRHGEQRHAGRGTDQDRAAAAPGVRAAGPARLPGGPGGRRGMPPGAPARRPGLPDGPTRRRGGRRTRIQGHHRGHDRDRLGALLVGVRWLPPGQPLPFEPRLPPRAQRLLPYRPAVRPGQRAGRRRAAGPFAPGSPPFPRPGFSRGPGGAPGNRAARRRDDRLGGGCRARVRLVASSRQAQPAGTRGINPAGMPAEGWCAAEGGDDTAQRPR